MYYTEIDNNCIKIIDGDKVLFPKAEDLFSEEQSFVFDGIEYRFDLDALGLKKSRFSKNAKAEFLMVDKKIVINLYIKESDGNRVKLPFIGGFFLDYYIKADRVYFVENVGFINSIIHSECQEKSEIGYLTYMKLARELHDAFIEFDDAVPTFVKSNEGLEKECHLEKLHATLYQYQKEGLSWLSFMYDNQCGCILGDEMGLGKTLQIIALMGYIKNTKTKPHILVIAPVSLLENWRREIEKFYPSLKVLVHHGQDRTGYYGNILDYDVILISYANVASDLSMLNMIQWDLVAVDEAQKIKNPYAQRTKAIKSLQRSMAIAITGTPFENHMSDLWSLIDFVIPGYLGTISQFESNFDDNASSATIIEQFLSPIMLRRKVLDVAKDLPKRIDIPLPIIMTSDEAKYYDLEREKVSKNELKSMKLQTIQGLRMFCTHPLVYNKDVVCDDPCKLSNKYSQLCDIIENIVSQDEKALIFTSFNTMSDILLDDLSKRFNIPVNAINGKTPVEERQNIIDEFSEHMGSAVLVLNPNAAGAGLNITAANHVIHYNLEWNPAVEDQASARSYRRGQNKTVFIYRLFYADTIEEIINTRIIRKRNLSEIAVVGNSGEEDNEDLLKALTMSPYRRNDK